MKRSGSLRFRLLIGTLAIVTTIWAFMAGFAWIQTDRETNEMFDANLAQTAALLAATIDDENESANEIIEHLASSGDVQGVAYQIWNTNHKLISQSVSAPKQLLSPIETGFSDSTKWRVYGAWTEDGRYLIQVAETYQSRNAVANELAEHLLLPLGIALPLLVLALVVLIRTTFVPLSKLADLIGQLSPEHLDPIPLDRTPQELHTILGKLNSLLYRVASSLQQERNFTGDAAHELRTPLAAMRANAQVARASLDDIERQQALDNVIAATDRTTHLLDQLLILAKLDATTLEIGKTSCDLRQVVAEALALGAPSAMTKNIQLVFNDSAPIHASVEPALFSILLRNIIDNAVRYSPPDKQVTIDLTQHGDDMVCIDIVDQGPGLALDELTRVRHRFYRVAGSNESGSGLGLSIASRIADLHRGHIEINNVEDGHGLCVRIEIPT